MEYGITIEFNRDLLNKEFANIQDAYDDLQAEMVRHNFSQCGNPTFYVSNLNGFDKKPLATLYTTIEALSNMNWVRRCIKKCEVFKVEDRSDFLSIVKG